MKNTVAIIGLGKMGNNISLRLRERGWRVLCLDRGDDFSKIADLPRPRTLLFSVPAQAFDKAANDAEKFLERGDIIIDSGNSFYKDSAARAKKYSKMGIGFVDMGISGGPSGARKGASLMIGGEKKHFDYLRELFEDLSIRDGVEFFPGAGAGHFVKMVHNGIEYGMMQALAEGVTILKKSKYKLDLKKVLDVYNHGSVIESRLVGWLLEAVKEYGEDFRGVSGKVGHTGEGEWTVRTAKALGVRAKVLEEALKFRIKSAKKPNWTGKLLTALRAQFGGHKIK